MRSEQRAKADDYFRTQIFPVLTPLAVDPGHPFPFISNLSLSIGVLLRQPGTGGGGAGFGSATGLGLGALAVGFWPQHGDSVLWA